MISGRSRSTLIATGIWLVIWVLGDSALETCFSFNLLYLLMYFSFVIFIIILTWTEALFTAA